LGVSLQNFKQLGGCADFFTSFYTDANFAIEPQRNSVKLCENLGKNTENLAMIRQAFENEGISRARVFEWQAR
jgi:hypothetical protein